MNGIWVRLNGTLEEGVCEESYGRVRCEWDTPFGRVLLHAKMRGKRVNTYTFPPPIEDESFTGDCFLSMDGSLTIEAWTQYCDSVMESINVEETEEEEEEEDAEVNRHGYEKDGFVVSEDELEEASYV